MPTLCVAVLLNTDNYIAETFRKDFPPSVTHAVYLIIFTGTFFLPATAAYAMFKSKAIKSMYMTDRDERTYPFVIAGCLYVLTYFMLQKLKLDPIFYSLLLGATISVFLALFINMKWKISIHMIGVGGLFGGAYAIAKFMNIQIHEILMIIMAMAGLIGFARLQLKQHVPSQIYAGFAIGFLSVSQTVLW